MNVDQLAADEPLSPELVLVLPPEVRAQAIARLGAPSWPAPRPYVPQRVAGRVLESVAESVPDHVVEHVPEDSPVGGRVLFDAPFLRSLGMVVAGRAVQLGLIFLAVTLGTLAMSVVPHAIRKPMSLTTVHCGRACEHAFVDLALRRTRTLRPHYPAAQPLLPWRASARGEREAVVAPLLTHAAVASPVRGTPHTLVEGSHLPVHRP